MLLGKRTDDKKNLIQVQNVTQGSKLAFKPVGK